MLPSTPTKRPRERTIESPRKRTRTDAIDASAHASRANGICRLLKLYVIALAQNVRLAEHLTSESSAVLRDRLFRVLTNNSETLSRMDASATAALYGAATTCSEELIAANEQIERALHLFVAATRDFTASTHNEAFRVFVGGLEPLLRDNGVREPPLDSSTTFRCTICLDDIAAGTPRCLLRRQCNDVECVQCECSRPQMCAQCVLKLIYKQSRGLLAHTSCVTCSRKFCTLDACIVGKV